MQSRNRDTDVENKSMDIKGNVYVHMCALSHVRLFATPGTEAQQAPLSRGFSRQEYWSGLPFPTSVDLPNPGIEMMSPALACKLFTTVPPEKPKGEWGWNKLEYWY